MVTLLKKFAEAIAKLRVDLLSLRTDPDFKFVADDAKLTTAQLKTIESMLHKAVHDSDGTVRRSHTHDKLTGVYASANRVRLFTDEDTIRTRSLLPTMRTTDSDELEGAVKQRLDVADVLFDANIRLLPLVNLGKSARQRRLAQLDRFVQECLKRELDCQDVILHFGHAPYATSKKYKTKYSRQPVEAKIDFMAKRYIVVVWNEYGIPILIYYISKHYY